MRFEWDEAKSQSNKIKHGIDFIEAQALWRDVDRYQVPAVTTDDEGRWFIFGKIEQRHWTAVITYREEKIRIISVRRSREKEKQIYEQAKSYRRRT